MPADVSRAADSLPACAMRQALITLPFTPLELRK